MAIRQKLSAGAWLARVVIALLLLAFRAVAQAQPEQQQQPQPQQGQSSSAAAPAKDQSGKAEQTSTDQQAQKPPQAGTSNDRLFFALPNFLTMENAGQLPPLTPGQKFGTVARASFDYIEYPWYSALAGISQAENSEPAYGQGATGYAKRYGTAFADGTIENFMTGAVIPTVLRQDPRFYQSGQGSFFRRTSYAVSRLFVTRGDNGHKQLNLSEIFGAGIAAMIGTYSYHPRNERNFSTASSVWGTQVGYDGITLEVKEFWPDIRRKLKHKTRSDPAAPDSSSR